MYSKLTTHQKERIEQVFIDALRNRYTVGHAIGLTAVTVFPEEATDPQMGDDAWAATVAHLVMSNMLFDPKMPGAIKYRDILAQKVDDILDKS